MGKVRTRYMVAFLVTLALFGTNGCLDGGTGDLQFVEQDPGILTPEREQQQTPLTSSSRVELSEPSVQQVNLCVLPFHNLTNREELDYFKDMFNQSIQYNLEDYVRVIQSTVMTDNEYSGMVDGLGRSQEQLPDVDVAQRIREQTGADYILFGNITASENEVRIEPFIISFEDGFLIRPMEPQPVSVNNFLAFMDTYIQELLDEIIQRRQE